MTTIAKPNIIWMGCPNYNTGHPINPNAPDPQAQQAIISIVDHITEGNRNSVKAKFQDPNSQASTHFLVNTDGSIWQFVGLGDSAWGNGIWEVPDTSVPWIADAYSNNKWPNGCTVSIEHEGNSGVPLTEAQYQATLALQRYLLSYFKLPADRNHIVGHYQIQSKNRANCPGPAYPWTRLMKDLATMIPPALAPNIGPGMTGYLTQHGLVPVTPEIYVGNGASILYCSDGTKLEAYENFDPNTGKPVADGSWTVKAFKLP